MTLNQRFTCTPRTLVNLRSLTANLTLFLFLSYSLSLLLSLSLSLSANADLYVNDAFGTAHRAHGSTEGTPTKLHHTHTLTHI